MFDYAVEGVILTATQLLILLGPALLIATIMHGLSTFTRRRAARLFGVDVFVWLTAPGTMVHELGHAVFCVIFRHRIVEMKLFEPDASGRLGYVDHSFNSRSLYQRAGNFFIGTGPIWFGTAVIWLLSRLLLSPTIFEPLSELAISHQDLSSWPAFTALIAALPKPVMEVFGQLLSREMLQSWSFYVFIYGVLCIGAHVTLSRPDLQGAAQGFVVLVAVLLIFNWSTLWLGDFALRACVGLAQYMAVFCSTMLFALALSAGLAVVVGAVSMLWGSAT